MARANRYFIPGHVVIDSGKDVIQKSMQLIAGRTAQAYNQRKSRKGAFRDPNNRGHVTKA